MQIYLHKSFLLGHNNSNNITDYPFFNSKEEELLNTLLLNLIMEKGNFCGANKNSGRSVINSVKNLCHTYNIRHYHFSSLCKTPCLVNQCLNFLTLKDLYTSSEVLHYLYNKQEDYIIIFGYSRIHDKGNFPRLDIRPLVDRLSYKTNISCGIYKAYNCLKILKENKLSLNIKEFDFLSFIFDSLSVNISTHIFSIKEQKHFCFFYNLIIIFCQEQAIDIYSLTKQDIVEIYTVFNTNQNAS